MGMEKTAAEKRAEDAVADVRYLLKRADDAERVLVLDLDGDFKKYANSHHDKEAVVVVATGPRAAKLRELLRSNSLLR